MKAHPLFVALHALSREIPVAAGASRLVRPAEVGASCPSFGGRRTVASSRKRMRRSCPSARTLSIEEPNYKSASLPQGQESLAFLALSIHRFNSSVSRAACASSVGMLRHPNTKQGCLPKSTA